MNLQPINLAMPEHVRTALDKATNSGTTARMAFNAKDSGDELELLVMDFVGDPFAGLSSDQIVRQLNDAKDKRVHVRINSMGGFAFDGLAIFNALVKHPGGVTTTVEGMAGSAASLIAQAGKPRRMMENSSQFVHRALAIAIGNSAVMRDAADFLDALDEGIAKTYVARTGLSMRRVNELLAGKVDGTTFTAAEAKELGFADEVVDLKPAKTTKNERQVPGNPRGGDGEATDGDWKEPALADFTGDEWGNVGPNTRAAIAKHFAVVPVDLSACGFGDLLLPHHSLDGKANLKAVQACLDALGGIQATGEVKRSARDHLESHLPVTNRQAKASGPTGEYLSRGVDVRLRIESLDEPRQLAAAS